MFYNYSLIEEITSVRKSFNNDLKNRRIKMAYHYNSETGKYGVCDAEKDKCPFIRGDSLEETQKLYENSMREETFSSVRKSTSIKSKHLRDVPAEILSKTPLKELDTAQLVQTLRHEMTKIGIYDETVDSAVNLATILHSHQTRGNRGNFTKTPYIEHPMRNAVRLIRLGVKDKDVIIATVLHDTIEDGAKVFVKKFNNDDSKVDLIHELDAREQLRSHIKLVYGKKVLSLVDAVTNDYVADTVKDKMPAEEKNRIYLEHVKKNIVKSPEIFLVKVSDFIDNATGLYNNDVPSRAAKTAKQAKKYLPVVKAFQDAMKNMDLPISDEGRKSIESHLEKTETRLKKIIAKYS